ncbi:hypothetical protein EYF80_019856 [Liparis tanakae]|uniref:Uncharacterized protein n=1 Tax=Liparis tanakae TaxID=230148 RepID=A0A4Z2HYC8_9TELE|nr:hypothetical protein EYF80_019856 [Liparis tanakae]
MLLCLNAERASKEHLMSYEDIRQREAFSCHVKLRGQRTWLKCKRKQKQHQKESRERGNTGDEHGGSKGTMETSMGTYQALVLDGLETLLPNAEKEEEGGEEEEEEEEGGGEEEEENKKKVGERRKKNKKKKNKKVGRGRRRT